MILYVNDRNEIKDVDSTANESLLAVEISDMGNPFQDWTKSKICCFKVEVTGGKVTMYAPYVNSEIIEHLDRLNSMNLSVSNSVTDIELAMTELYEMMLGGM